MILCEIFVILCICIVISFYVVVFLAKVLYHEIANVWMVIAAFHWEPHHNDCYYWCGTCYVRGRYDSELFVRENMRCDKTCMIDGKGHCRQYRCEENELPITYDENGNKLEYETNYVCGKYYTITRRGCYCSKDYPYRRQGDYKCVKEC